MQTYAYYPGCSLGMGAKEFDVATRAVFDRLGVGLQEIPDWSCCGSSQAHKVDRELATAFAGRNLVLANGIGDIVAPCTSCSLSLKEAAIELEHDGPARRLLAEVGLEYQPGSVRVVSATEAIYRALEEGLFDGKVGDQLAGLRVASYYGCLLVRPPQVAQFDDPENPVSLDKITKAAGAIPVDWSHKTECCGNAYSLSNRDMTLHIVTNILNAAIDAGADIIIAPCPLCQQNLAERQSVMKQSYGLKREVPVLYFTQLIGAGLGIDNKKLDFNGDIMGLINSRRQAVKEVG